MVITDGKKNGRVPELRLFRINIVIIIITKVKVFVKLKKQTAKVLAFKIPVKRRQFLPLLYAALLIVTEPRQIPSISIYVHKRKTIIVARLP